MADEIVFYTNPQSRRGGPLEKRAAFEAYVKPLLERPPAQRAQDEAKALMK